MNTEVMIPFYLIGVGVVAIYNSYQYQQGEFWDLFERSPRYVAILIIVALAFLWPFSIVMWLLSKLSKYEG
jgi:multisubunit Na+/H+ antiporter MnhB subunit